MFGPNLQECLPWLLMFRFAFYLTRTGIRTKITPACTVRQAGVRYARKQMMSFYGLWPMPPSSVRVSPDIYLKSGMASWTQTRPISVSALP